MLLIEDLAVGLTDRSYEIALTGDAGSLRTRPIYAPAIRAAADLGEQELDLREFDVAVTWQLRAYPL